MKQAANLNFEIGIYLPGTRIRTSPTDFAPIEQLQMMKFKGESWELFGPLMSGEKTRKVGPLHVIASHWACVRATRWLRKDVTVASTRDHKQPAKRTKMLITDVRAHHIRIPYDAGVASFRQGASAIAALEIVLVEVSTDAGVTGWGDAFAYVSPRTTRWPSRR